jgi:hypothetical protein
MSDAEKKLGYKQQTNKRTTNKQQPPSYNQQATNNYKLHIDTDSYPIVDIRIVHYIERRG